MSITETKKWYNESYRNSGFSAQRLYPNEELLRFFGRNFFNIPLKDRKGVRVLEVGCGSCSNLWMIAHEGFEAFGIDLSRRSIELGREMLNHWSVTAQLTVGSMTELPYEDGSFGVLCDIFSSNCLPIADFKKFLIEAHRVMQDGGKIMIYTPSIESDAFKNYYPAKKIDEFTLNGIYRESSPFGGNHYPFRFASAEWLIKELELVDFRVDYCEVITRSYHHRSEHFQHISLEATKL
jgi:ubiquinone/menaquinone biosynthesis C-methylase UbiE